MPDFLRDPETLAECRALQDAIRRHPTLAALHASPDARALEARFRRVLDRVHRVTQHSPPAASDDPTRLRAVQWNVEHGNQYAQIERALLEHPRLAGADLVFCNEIDLGCARAGNRDVTADLARALGFHCVFAPLFLESTIGRDDDALTAGDAENQEGLFGNAILSRYPIGEVRLVELPSPLEIQFDLERMYGRHAALVATIERPGAPFVAVSVHLEVHRTRAHRAAQLSHVLQSLATEHRPVVIAGDMNTHTFDRGLWHAPIEGAASLVLWPGAALSRRLRWPDRGRTREFLFDTLREAGFEWDRFVDRQPTLRLRAERVEELHALPAVVRALAHPMVSYFDHRAQLRLDWFAGRGWHDGRGETVNGLDGRGLASDHAPIVAELV